MHIKDISSIIRKLLHNVYDKIIDPHVDTQFDIMSCIKDVIDINIKRNIYGKINNHLRRKL